MRFETEDRHGQSAPQLPQPQSTRCASRDLVGDRRPLGDANSDWVQLRAPTSQGRAPSGPQVEALAPEREDQHVERADDERRDEPRKSMLQRHPLAFVGGLILLLLLLPARSVYWDYPSHFESTAQPFTAAPHFPTPPKTPRYPPPIPAPH